KKKHGLIGVEKSGFFKRRERGMRMFGDKIGLICGTQIPQIARMDCSAALRNQKSGCFTCSPVHLFTCSPVHLFTRSPAHPLTFFHLTKMLNPQTCRTKR
ncbi:MAG: hypothetical protein U1B83_01395, partial [Candidatus Cloacimonadaceae bacterium]|nr:hypothetical protein [Candidatus Cloacimonadaceae bacterium]